MTPYMHPIKLGFTDVAVMRAVKRQLIATLAARNDPSIALDPDDPVFDRSTQEAVKLFQARNTDSNGQPLKQDGIIGMLTWERLFGPQSVPNSTAASSALLGSVLKVAAGEEARHVREVPPNSNAGPDVLAYLGSVRASAGQPWCCAFVYWCFQKAATAANETNPMYRTAGCLDHWNHAEERGANRVSSRRAATSPELVSPGAIFVMDHGGGKGHTGLVERVTGGLLTTIEGNTDASRTREGGGVYRLTRKTKEINLGFIVYG